MSLTLLRESVRRVISDDTCSGEFYFLFEDEGHISIKRADIAADASTELAQEFIHGIANLLANDELSLLPLTRADDRANVIYEYDLPDHPDRMQCLATVMRRDDFDNFTFGADDLAQLVGILLLLGHGDEQLVLYKHQYPIALLTKSKFSLVRAGNQSRFEQVSGDILRVNPKFEIFFIEGKYFVVDLKTLERFFGFHDAVKNIAMKGIANIESSHLVVDTGPLADRLGDITFARKLARVASSSPVLGVIPNAEVIAFVETHPLLTGKFRVSANRSRLKLDTKVSQDLFLKLLNDNFLRSELTKRYYDSLTKDDLEELTEETSVKDL